MSTELVSGAWVQPAQPVLPPAMLGMLGGGQLGRMFLLAAKAMGYRVAVLDPDPQSPAGLLADQHWCCAYDNEQALSEMAQACAAISTEFENVPATTMEVLARLRPVSPSPQCVAIAQDRIQEKRFLQQAGLPTAPFVVIEQTEDLTAAACQPCLPGILKLARLGYDGKGQVHVQTMEQLHAAWQDLGRARCVLERKLTLESEISVIVCRAWSGEIQVYPAAENQHVGGILDISVVPARVAPQWAEQARAAAQTLAQKLNYVGVLAVEFFITSDLGLCVNEMAPRPHNSGHYTQNATATCQFEQQVRLMCGLPPADTSLHSPVAMVNLLGDVWPKDRSPDWARLLQSSACHLHLYAKQEARPGRKMGHFNVLGSSAEVALQQAQELRAALLQP